MIQFGFLLSLQGQQKAKLNVMNIIDQGAVIILFYFIVRAEYLFKTYII